jgi:glycosyltransferase involved in cell wall biosynthesis
MNELDDKGLVTVIIPTYNRAKLIGRALDSARAQTYPYKQIVVVDDGSTDDTADLVRQYADVEYVYRENGGQAAARTTGLEHARGHFIACLDSDDVWEPFFLERCIGAMEAHRLDFVFANWYQQWADGRIADYFAEFVYIQPYLKGRSESPMLFSYPQLRQLYLECCPSPSSSVVIRRDSFVSTWNDRIHLADDWCLLLDIVLSKEVRGALIREKLWHKSINDDNIYDGRDYYEVLKLMYIEDTMEMLRRYGRQLKKEEIRVLQERCIDNTLRMTKLTWKSRSHILPAFGKLVRALLLNPRIFVRLGWKKLRHAEATAEYEVP